MIITTREGGGRLLKLDTIYYKKLPGSSMLHYNTRFEVYALLKKNWRPVKLGTAHTQINQPKIMPETASEIFTRKYNGTREIVCNVLKKWNGGNLPKDLKNIYEI